jgi:hypothetical protein
MNVGPSLIDSTALLRVRLMAALQSDKSLHVKWFTIRTMSERLRDGMESSACRAGGGVGNRSTG